MARSWQSGELASSPCRLLKHVIPKEWREAICQPRSPGRVAQRQSKHVRWFVQRARDAGEEDAPCWRSDRTPLSPVVPPRIWLRLLCSGLCPVSPQVLWAELVSTASAPLRLFLEGCPSYLLQQRLPCPGREICRRSSRAPLLGVLETGPGRAAQTERAVGAKAWQGDFLAGS